ncbi:MAG: iron ABC transporter substrate-binding protein [Deltaproteobacteria bacterium]|jgi:iron(III) transport system substrate-binding protein|nr:iron ABC transporter substrate-binding protein [Deltaproteobacteria bacterium]MDP7317764.1 extracellular solute-binding protein [SAR324 cluster bacterium]
MLFRAIAVTALFLSSLQVLAAAEVNVLSSRQEFLLRPFLERFEKDTNIKVNVAYLKKGLLERLQQQPGAVDLVLTVDIAHLTKMSDAGLFQPHGSSVIVQNVPVQFRDVQGRWTALTTRARIIYHSLKRVKPEEIPTYEALADAKWQGRICIRSGYHNYNVALISSMLEHHGTDATRNWLKGLKANLARKPQGNDRGQVKAIYEGLCDLSVGNTYYMGKMLTNPDQQAWAASVGILFPNQEGRGTHMNVSGGAIAAKARNRAEAVKLLEFLTGKHAQYLYAEVNHEYPVKSGVGLSSIVRGFGSQQPGIKNGTFHQDSLDLTRIGARRNEAIRLLDEVNFDQ